MRDRRRVALLFLAILALPLCGALVAGACDDACAPDCGDCAACPQVAVVEAVPSLAGRPGVAARVPSRRTTIPASTPRQVDHVPLRLVA